jgi:hydrophobic/amphiphilic exporter-1 (mainly G- bacteria), HAE1 family
MGLPDFSTKRPVTTVMIFAGVILFGIISLTKLPQELFPPITYPQLTVFTVYANAAPEEVETLLTRPIEEAVGTVSGLKALKSISKEGISIVMAEFDWDQNMDFASLRTREKVDLIKARLPRDSSEPLVVPFNPFELPIMTISVTGDRSPMEIRRIATDSIKDELEKINGVASASVEGGLEREIIVEVNQSRLNSYGATVLDVSDAITNANLNYPAGTIKESFYEYLIRTLGEFEEVSEIGEVIIRDMSEEEQQMSYDEKLALKEISHRPALVKIKDVAAIFDTFKERTSYSRYNGEDNVAVSVQKQAQANTMHVINGIRGALPRLRNILPPDIQLEIVYDQSVFISDAINGVKDAAFQGGILAFLVLLVFLKSFKPAGIVTMSIPISVMVVFTFMHFGGISINMMSLGGLALGVGMLVDNAVVVIENIFRHREQGKSAEQAARDGAEEVSNAITASTLTTIAVFFPMIFVVGVAGQLFKELAFTVTFSLIASLWVALTIIPLMSCKLGEKTGKVSDKEMSAFSGGKAWKRFLNKYENFLKFFLSRKKTGLAIVMGLFVASLFLVNFIEKELMPKTDQGQFVVQVDMPVGTKLEHTNGIALKMEDIFMGIKDVSSVSTTVGSTSGGSSSDIVQRLGSHQAEIIVDLDEKREAKTPDIVRDIQLRVSEDPAFRNTEINFTMYAGVMSGAFGTAGGKPVTIEIKGPALHIMENITKEVTEKLAEIDGILAIEDDAPETSPEVKIVVDKNKSSLYNISVVDLAKAAQIALRGFVSSKFKEKGKEVDIRVRLREDDRGTYENLSRVRISSRVSGMVPLGVLAKLERGRGPSEIKRSAQERTIVVSADIKNRKVSEAISDVESMISKLDIPAGYAVRLAGESEEMKQSFASLQFALILSLVMVYMIMAAQFESLTQPLIILFSVPLSLIGVLATLFATGTSISVIALLGVIMLGGIVVNNGIILIDYTNILMQAGKNRDDAVVEASLARLRPIMMTVLTTVLGLFPMALAMGRGSELRSPIAISVMGGLVVSTFLTLVVIPSVFLVEGEIREKIINAFKK